MSQLRRITILLAGAFLLVACVPGPSPTSIPTVSLDVSSSETVAADVVASAEVVPAQKVQLSFPTTGIVKTVDVAEGDMVSAGQTVATLDTAILEARVAQAEADVVAAETQVRYLKRVGSGQEQIDAAIADGDRAKASLDSAKAMLAQATLNAPIGGTVAQVNISPGEAVIPGQIVVLIGDLSRMKIETTDLSERDIPGVKEGMPANVFIEALDEEFTARVTNIARVSSTIGGDVVYKVTVELDEQPQGLRWGMSAEVRIQTKQ